MPNHELTLPRPLEQTKNAPKHRHEFLLLSHTEKQKLAHQLTESQGRIRMIVHPFDNKPNRHNVGYYRALNTLLASPSPDQLPTIVFFESKYFAESIRTYKRLIHPTLKGKTYFVPTYDANPTPNYNKAIGLPNNIIESTNWPLFIRQLKDIGVVSALVGGQSLIMISGGQETEEGRHLNQQISNLGWPDSNYITFQGCVGMVATELSRDFDVEISNIATPTNPPSFYEISNAYHKYERSKLQK